MAATITKEEFVKLRTEDPLADIPPDFPRSHTRFPLVPSDIFNKAIEGAQPHVPLAESIKVVRKK